MTEANKKIIEEFKEKFFVEEIMEAVGEGADAGAVPVGLGFMKKPDAEIMLFWLTEVLERVRLDAINDFIHKEPAETETEMKKLARLDERSRILGIIEEMKENYIKPGGVIQVESLETSIAEVKSYIKALNDLKNKL